MVGVSELSTMIRGWQIMFHMVDAKLACLCCSANLQRVMEMRMLADTQPGLFDDDSSLLEKPFPKCFETNEKENVV
jgi:hypothetical protein